MCHKSVDIMNDEIVHVYKRRWWMLFLLCLFSVIGGFNWVSFSIIPDAVMRYFRLESSVMVDLMALIYFGFYIPVALPGMWLLENKGFRFCLLLGTLGMAMGSWIKAWMCHPDYYLGILFGQAINAVFQVFFLSVPVPLAATWFPDNEVATATAIGLMGNLIGIALGYVLPPILVPLTSDDEVMDHNFKVFLYGVAAAATAVFILFLVSFQNAPQLPPSLANYELLQAGKPSMKESIKSLMTDKNFLKLLLSFSLNYGSFSAFSSLLGQFILQSYPNQPEHAGIIGLLFPVAGMFSFVILGYLLDKTKKFKTMLCWVYILTLGSFFLFTFTIGRTSIWLTYVAVFILGFFLNGYPNIGFEVGAEFTYPQPETYSSILLEIGSSTSAILILLTAGQINKKKNILGANLYIGSLLLIGNIITFFLEEKLKRHQKSSPEESEKRYLQDRTVFDK